MNEIVIGTRGSELALWQANFIKSRLEQVTDIPATLRIIKTLGDKIDNLSFDKIEGKGFFTKEIEDALLARDIDLAVHSLKDLMTTMPPGLALTAVGFREDSREALLINKDAFDPGRPLKVKENGILGSSSVRRQCQVAHLSPDLTLKDLRGNVPTRINKLRDGQYDAIILAQAGIRRLEIDLSEPGLLQQADEFVFFVEALTVGALPQEAPRAGNNRFPHPNQVLGKLALPVDRDVLGRLVHG